MIIPRITSANMHVILFMAGRHPVYMQ